MENIYPATCILCYLYIAHVLFCFKNGKLLVAFYPLLLYKEQVVCEIFKVNFSAQPL